MSLNPNLETTLIRCCEDRGVKLGQKRLQRLLFTCAGYGLAKMVARDHYWEWMLSEEHDQSDIANRISQLMDYTRPVTNELSGSLHLILKAAESFELRGRLPLFFNSSRKDLLALAGLRFIWCVPSQENKRTLFWMPSPVLIYGFNEAVTADDTRRLQVSAASLKRCRQPREIYRYAKDRFDEDDSLAAKVSLLECEGIAVARQAKSGAVRWEEG
jgi:hypothetical protein